MANLYPVDDADAQTLVRGLTLYEDNSDELPASDLSTHLRIAKMRLNTKTDSSEFYSDNGLGQALVATTAIVAKAAVENYSITRWDLGVGEIDVSGAGDEDVAQFSQWASMAAEGIANSKEGGSQSATNINSGSYIGQ